jgi:hypothetical protein
MLLKLLVHICRGVANPRACCVGLLDFSGPAALLCSICVDIAGLRLKDVAAWVSWISPGLLRSIFVVYCMWEILRSFRVSACGSHLVCG